MNPLRGDIKRIRHAYRCCIVLVASVLFGCVNSERDENGIVGFFMKVVNYLLNMLIDQFDTSLTSFISGLIIFALIFIGVTIFHLIKCVYEFIRKGIENKSNYGTWSTTSGMSAIWPLIRMPFLRCFDYKGRSRRAEYWLFVLLFTLISLIDGLFEFIFYRPIFIDFLMLGVYFCIMMIHIPLTTRRLHDVNFSGWWQLIFVLLAYVYFIGHGNYINDNQTATLFFPIFILAMLGQGFLMFCSLMKGVPGSNKYGGDPLTGVKRSPDEKRWILPTIVVGLVYGFVVISIFL